MEFLFRFERILITNMFDISFIFEYFYDLEKSPGTQFKVICLGANWSTTGKFLHQIEKFQIEAGS